MSIVLDIAIVDASIGDTPAQENLEAMTEARTTAYKVSDGDMPPPPTAETWTKDAVIVSGSQTSVYEDRDWIHELTDWARSVHEAGVPVLGICWGHQFMAQALGGRIVAMDEYELGYESIRQVQESELLAGIPETFQAFETHSDRVEELPEAAVVLADNAVGIQAFELGTTYGVQFHPEYDLQTAKKVTKRKDLPEAQIERVLAGITESAYETAKEATRVFSNFESIVDRTVQPA